MKNIFLLATVLLFFVAGIVLGRNLESLRPLPDEMTRPPVPSAAPTATIVGNDTDAHGCIGSAGYTWCEVQNKCLREWEEECDIVTSLKEAIIAKDHLAGDIVVTVKSSVPGYAYGTVNGRNELGGGGMFLAAKQDSRWIIAYSGNGLPDCPALKSGFNFPADMLSHFCR